MSQKNVNAPGFASSFDEGQGAPTRAAGPQEEAPIRVDGFRQVLEMLRIADPAFRESLLRRLAQRDRELARSLRADLGI